MGGEGEIDWDGEMREWIKRGGGERKEEWNGVKHFFSFIIIYTPVFSIVFTYTCLLNLLVIIPIINN